MVKNYVLDTNVLIHDPEAVFKFGDNNLFIPIFVVEEIDQFKKEGSERGRACRHVSRVLDDLRSKPGMTLSKGVPLGEGLGKLTVVVPDGHEQDKVRALDHGAQDRAILQCALDVRAKHRKQTTVFVTMDTNLRIRADAFGMPAETYENSRTKVESASSVVQIDVAGQEIDDFFHYGRSVAGLDAAKPRPNASVMLRDSASHSHSALGRYDAKKQEIVQLKTPKEGIMGIRPKSREQAFALDLLLNDDVKLVTLVGKAGTGKTLLAIAAGLQRTLNDGTYTRMLVSRPIMPLGKDLGYLPGTVEEKLNPWMQPIFDNLEFLFGREKKGEGSTAYADLMESGQLQVEPLTYIRGRSLPYQYIIVDEAQNLTPHEIKTIITRAGEGSKIILTGDPDQIDNPYVDEASNGLSVVADRFRDQPAAGHVVLTRGERSELAELAANLL